MVKMGVSLIKLGRKNRFIKGYHQVVIEIFQVVFRRVTVPCQYIFPKLCDIYNQFVRMKDNKESAKQSMIKMYNVNEFYQVIDKVGRGTYGTVYKAKGLKDGRFYAIKKLQNNDTKLQQEGFPITALREITLLKQIDHPNIIKLKEIIVSRPSKRNLFRGSTFLVFEYMDHDFAGLFKMKCKFTLPEIKSIIAQLLEGVAYLHRNKILHRDIKSANILLNDQGDVKLADFGLGRKIRFQNYFTYKVVTLWYRAPQLLLGYKSYTDKIDVWSVGCVVAQFFTGQVLFKKQTEYALMERIYEIAGDFQTNQMKFTDESFKIYQNLQDLRPRKRYTKQIGSYLKKHCPNISDTSIDFIDRLLSLDPNKRMSCEQALRHPFFSQKPLACNKIDIQKMEYQCHQMFKDRSVKIERTTRNDEETQGRANKLKQIKQSRDTRQLKERQKQNQQKNSKPYRQDKDYRSRDNKSRPNRFYYEKRKDSKYRSSEDNSSYQRKSKSYSSSSKSRSSQYSSSSRSRSRSRSRHNSRRGKEDSRKNRDQFKSNRDRDNYTRKDDKRREDRKDERRDLDKYERQRKGDYERKDKYYRNEKDQRYSGYKDYRRKDQRPQGKRQYRDERISFKKDDKIQERREDKDEKQRKDERRGGQRDQRKDYREKRDDWRRDSKQRKYERNQKPGLQSRGRYYEDRDYNRRQQKRGQKNLKADERYQENQKHGDYYRKDDVSQKKLDKKYYYVSGKEPLRKKEYRNSSSSQRSSNHHYKKSREYSRKPYSYQRKNHYKKSHSDSNDHRNH